MEEWVKYTRKSIIGFSKWLAFHCNFGVASPMRLHVVWTVCRPCFLRQDHINFGDRFIKWFYWWVLFKLWKFLTLLHEPAMSRVWNNVTEKFWLKRIHWLILQILGKLQRNSRTLLNEKDLSEMELISVDVNNVYWTLFTVYDFQEGLAN